LPQKLTNFPLQEYGLQFIGQFPDPGPWKAGVAKPYQPKAYVGIDVVPRQLVNRLKKKPYVFNLMVVGKLLNDSSI
jgi:hypothetical protein